MPFGRIILINSQRFFFRLGQIGGGRTGMENHTGCARFIHVPSGEGVSLSSRRGIGGHITRQRRRPCDFAMIAVPAIVGDGQTGALVLVKRVGKSERECVGMAGLICPVIFYIQNRAAVGQNGHGSIGIYRVDMIAIIWVVAFIRDGRRSAVQSVITIERV